MQIEHSFDRKEFDRRAAEFRYVITEIMCRAGSGHLGGALSLVEILITMYWRILRIDPSNPSLPERDRFVLSKGHAGPVLYTALAFRGYFPPATLLTLNADGTSLPSHCDMLKTPGIDMTAGSLGQGLSAAAGMALGGRIAKKPYNVFCVVGDGESDEGQIWEAALFAAHHKLDNLVAITDYNKLQIDGTTKEILNLDPLADKWRSFNWEVFEMDGHDWNSIYNTLQKAIACKGKPSMIIANTIKAKGHPAYENKVESHNVRIPDAKTRDDLLAAVKVDGFVWPPV